jgi:hypothetical protein
LRSPVNVEDLRMRLAPPRIVMVAAWMVLAVQGVALAQASQRQPLILPGDEPDLLLFYTGDVIGYVDPCG